MRVTSLAQTSRPEVPLVAAQASRVAFTRVREEGVELPVQVLMSLSMVALPRAAGTPLPSFKEKSSEPWKTPEVALKSRVLLSRASRLSGEPL